MRTDVKEKYLKDIKGVNKARDYSILEYQAMNPQATYAEIKEKLELDVTEARVGHIVAEHWHIVLKLFAGLNYLSMPEGRAFERARAFFKKKDLGVETRKDPLDILNDMEDDKAAITNQTFIVTYGHRTGTPNSAVRVDRRTPEPA